MGLEKEEEFAFKNKYLKQLTISPKTKKFYWLLKF